MLVIMCVQTTELMSHNNSFMTLSYYVKMCLKLAIKLASV